MNTLCSATFGLIFLGLGIAATFLMYYLWGFPFDKTTRTSSAPKWLMRVHRVIGYSYASIYVLIMIQMAPRMWQYQVELPPRTVAHLILGFLIGLLLILKITIMRFFRHLEEWMPYLGTAMLVCTVLLLGLSLPFVFREGSLAAGASRRGVFSSENRKRVAGLLPEANFPAGTHLKDLATEAGLRAGRSVLLEKCVRCHDLKTILERPRSPSDWVSTVQRMAAKPALFAPITSHDQGVVCAYLIAITPNLPTPEQDLQQLERPASSQAVVVQDQAVSEKVGGMDGVKANATFQRVCSQCHSTRTVDKSPPKTEAAVRSLIQRMRDNGMSANAQEIQAIRFHLTSTFVKTH